MCVVDLKLPILVNKKLKFANVIGLLLLLSFVSFSHLAFANKQQRIVALSPHLVEILFDLGVGEQIVGALEFSDHPIAAQSIPRIGGAQGINIEKLIALEPDIVFVWQGGNQAKDIEQIKRLGFNLVFSNPKQLFDLADEINHFGKVLNLETKAQEVTKKYVTRLSKLQNTYADQRAVNVFYQLWPEPLMTINGSTWINQLLTVCGANNVFSTNSSPYPQVGIENVIKAQPEVIIVPAQHDRMKEIESSEQTLFWQQWPEIPAVNKNNFIIVNADLLHRNTPRMLLGLEPLCQQIHKFRN